MHHVDTLLRIAALCQRNGSPERSIEYLRTAALEDEFNENVYGALIRGYCSLNRYADAVAVCQQHQSVLSAEGLTCSQNCFSAMSQGRNPHDREATM